MYRILLIVIAVIVCGSLSLGIPLHTIGSKSAVVQGRLRPLVCINGLS